MHDEVVLENGAGQFVVHRGMAMTANAMGVVGAINSLDTGALAASKWYGVFDIYNPTTQTFASLLSAVSPVPTTSQVAGGALAAATYYIRIAYVNANGISLPSWSVPQAVSVNNLLKVTSPAALAGATGYNVYVGTTFGNEQLQNAAPITIGTDWTMPVGGLVAGALPANPWPTVMPAGYTHRALLGGVITDSSASKYLCQMRKEGRKTQYSPLAGSNNPSLPIVSSGVQGNIGIPTFVAVSVQSVLPPWATLIHLQACQAAGVSCTQTAAPSAAYGAYNSANNRSPLVSSVGTSGGHTTQGSFLLESQSVYVSSDAAGNYLAVIGFEDAL